MAVSVVEGEAGRRDGDVCIGDVLAKLLILISGAMDSAGLTQHDNEGEMQHGAEEWLIILERGCRRLQELVEELSERSNEEPGTEVGAISLAGWLNDTTKDIMQGMWELEEGLDPQLDAFIDWRRADSMMNTCTALFAKGRDLRFLLEDGLASIEIIIPTTVSTTLLSTSEAAATSTTAISPTTSCDQLEERRRCAERDPMGNNDDKDDDVEGSFEDNNDTNNNSDDDNNNNSDNNNNDNSNNNNNNNNNNNDGNNNDDSDDNNNNDNIINNNNNNNNNNQFQITKRTVHGLKGIDNNNGAVGSSGDADNNSTNNIDDNDNDG
ncbi:hypothetical protein CBR_g48459 [Chara braunii]|uniref:Uncharacterized protein n=1 Tax=Chara braunii TaxID=69332 RepID=A0A388M2P1_CHABU|nr:hypothetical protein CBR_g48459 [Chara braunii]|eukprot:GBG88847.1 hypothetical protein CBR_g48459 [Chara braunii]